VDYRLQGMSLSRLDCEVIARLVSQGRVPADESAFLEAQDPGWRELSRCRERDECLEKLKRLGIVRGT